MTTHQICDVVFCNDVWRGEHSEPIHASSYLWVGHKPHPVSRPGLTSLPQCHKHGPLARPRLSLQPSRNRRYIFHSALVRLFKGLWWTFEVWRTHRLSLNIKIPFWGNKGLFWWQLNRGNARLVCSDRDSGLIYTAQWRHILIMQRKGNRGLSLKKKQAFSFHPMIQGLITKWWTCNSHVMWSK